MSPRMRVILLDNRDSFVYNLVDQFASLGADIEVYRNQVPAAQVLAALAPTPQEADAAAQPVLCLSPGPGHPRTSGCLMELTRAAISQGVPTIGICLGFQAIVEACGGSVGRVGAVHGRSTRVEVTEAGRRDPAMAPLNGGPLDVARYHSLGTTELPADLVSLAVTGAEDPAQPGVIMAARHATAPVIGMQFHPESVLTPAGPLLLRAMIQDLATG